jgi:hypothetical protein
MEKERFDLRMTFGGALTDEIEKIKDFYCEPLSKVLYIDVVALIRKHSERAKASPSELLIKK